MTEEEFLKVVSKKFTEDKVYQLRMYDFEDLAIEFAYNLNEDENEDVEIKFSDECYANY